MSFLLLSRLKFSWPVLEHLTIRPTITLDIFTLENSSESKMRQVSVWLRPPHFCEIDVFELVTGLDETRFCLGNLLVLFLFVRILVTRVFHAAEYDLRQRIIIFLHLNSRPRHYQRLKFILGLWKTDVLGRIQVGADTDWLCSLWDGHCIICLLYQTDCTRVILVED